MRISFVLSPSVKSCLTGRIHVLDDGLGVSVGYLNGCLRGVRVLLNSCLSSFVQGLNIGNYV